LAGHKAAVLLVVHLSRSDVGRIGRMLSTRGHPLDIRCPLEGDPLPERLDGYAAAVVLGGPMRANDEHLAGIGAEPDRLPSVLEAATPFLGVCLGAQLPARVLGARLAPHPEGIAEIGYFPIRPTAAADGFLDDSLRAYHWHREGFELPRDTILLAEGGRFPNQAYRYGRHAYGLQYPPEVTRDIMIYRLESAADKLALPGAQGRDEHLSGHARHDAGIDAWLDRFLGRRQAPAASSPAAGSSAEGS
jgi:GMP synthase (glutamine-hydrolysing)